MAINNRKHSIYKVKSYKKRPFRLGYRVYFKSLKNGKFVKFRKNTKRLVIFKKIEGFERFSYKKITRKKVFAKKQVRKPILLKKKPSKAIIKGTWDNINSYYALLIKNLKQLYKGYDIIADELLYNTDKTTDVIELNTKYIYKYIVPIPFNQQIKSKHLSYVGNKTHWLFRICFYFVDDSREQIIFMVRNGTIIFDDGWLDFDGVKNFIDDFFEKKIFDVFINKKRKGKEYISFVDLASWTTQIYNEHFTNKVMYFKKKKRRNL